MICSTRMCLVVVLLAGCGSIAPALEPPSGLAGERRVARQTNALETARGMITDLEGRVSITVESGGAVDTTEGTVGIVADD